MLDNLVSDRAQEYKADVSATRLAKLGYHAKAIQSATEILNSISNIKDSSKNKFWKDRNVDTYGEESLNLIADFAHGSLFNRNVNLEVIFKYFEFGIEDNTRPTQMPDSWKKVTNKGFLYELSDTPENKYWRELITTAPQGILNIYFQDFMKNFNKEMDGIKSFINGSFDVPAISAWQKLYNTILFQRYLQKLDIGLNKLDFLSNYLLSGNSDKKQHLLLLMSTTDQQYGRNSIDLFERSLSVDSHLDSRSRVFTRFSINFFKLINRRNRTIPNESDLNAELLNDLANEKYWQHVFTQKGIDIQVFPEDILDYLLVIRSKSMKARTNDNLNDYVASIEDEFKEIKNLESKLDENAYEAYQSKFRSYLSTVISGFEAILVGKVRDQDENFDSNPHWDQVIAFYHQLESYTNEEIFLNITTKYSFENTLEGNKKEKVLAHLRQKLKVTEDSSKFQFDPTVFSRITQLSDFDQEKKRQELSKNLISLFSGSTDIHYQIGDTYEAIYKSNLESTEKEWLVQAVVDFALNKENLVKIYPGDDSQSAARYDLAQKILNKFSFADKILDLSNTLQKQYLDYLKSLVNGKNWLKLAKYLNDIKEKYNSGGHKEFSLEKFADFEFIQILQSYLNSVSLYDIKQNISGFSMEKQRGLFENKNELSSLTVSEQVKAFFEVAVGSAGSVSSLEEKSFKRNVFGRNNVEVNLLQPIIDFEISHFESRVAKLDGVELYKFYEEYYPNVENKSETLDKIAAKLFKEIEFDEAYQFVQHALENGNNHYVHYFLENHVRTLEEYRLVAQGDNAQNILNYQNSGLNKVTAFDTLVSNLITNLDNEEAIGFFEASINGDDEKVKYYLAKYYSSLVSYGGDSTTTQRLKSSLSSIVTKELGVFVTEDGTLVGSGVSSFPTFEEFALSFYKLPKLKKTALISKLLAEKLLLDKSNFSKIATLLTNELEDSSEINLKPLLKKIVESTLSQRIGSTKIQLGISRSLADAFLQGDPRKVSNDFAVETLVDGVGKKTNKREKFDENHAKQILSRLLNQKRDSILQANSDDFQSVFNAHEKIINIANKTINRLEIEQEDDYIDGQQENIPVGKFITELAKSLGSLGVRFLQVFGQYFDLPPELQNEFLSVYDDASDLYMANLFQSSLTAIDTLKNSNGNTTADEKLFNNEQSKKIEKMLPNLKIVKKIGGGSINTTYLVEIDDPQTGGRALKVLKISNPNVLLDVAEVGSLVKAIVSDLEKIDKKNKDNYSIVQRLMQTLEQWNAEDIQDKNFLINDPLFSQFYPYQSEHGFEFGASQVVNIYNRWIKLDDYVEGDTLKKIMADLETEISNQGGHPTTLQLVRAQRIEELIADITADYVRHLNEPVTLENGRQACILHSDLHVGNVMADKDLTKVSVIDRSYYLVFSLKEVELVRSLLSTKEPDVAKFTNLTRHLLEVNSVGGKGAFTFWKTYLSYAKVALKNKFTSYQSEEDKQVAFFNAMMQETDRLELDFPLNIRLFVKNMSAINKMLSKIGDDKLGDYLNDEYKTEYDGGSLMEKFGVEINDDRNVALEPRLETELLFKNEISEEFQLTPNLTIRLQAIATFVEKTSQLLPQNLNLVQLNKAIHQLESILEKNPDLAVQAAIEIKNLAEKLDVDKIELFYLLKIFLLSDAGTYSRFSDSFLEENGTFTFSVENQKLLEEVEAKLNQSSGLKEARVKKGAEVNNDERAIDILRNSTNEDFPNQVQIVMDNAPSALLDINKDYYAKTRIKSDKFAHTQKTLRLLDTDGLGDQDRFIARAAMMLHDCDPEKVINNLSEWVNQREITNVEAVRIMQQVWWHDLLGIDINNHLDYTSQIARVIPNDVDRNINLRIFEADIKFYGFEETYSKTIKEVQDLTAPKSAKKLSQLSDDSLADLGLAPPGDGDIFVHGIYTRSAQQRTAEITPLVLLNLLASNSVKSTSLITMLENRKTSKNPPIYKATDSELNVFRFQSGSFPEEIGAFGQQPDNWLTIVYFGRDIKDDVAVKPLTTAEEVPYVAGLVNKFSDNDEIIGCELGLDQAYFIIKTEAVGSLIPLLKLQALRLNQDPDSYINSRVIIQGKEDKLEDLTVGLQKGTLDIKNHNSKRLIEGLNYSGYTYDSFLIDRFDTIIQDGTERKHFSSKKNKNDNKNYIGCRVIDSEGFKSRIISEKLSDRVKAFPWLADKPFLKEFEEKIRSDNQQRENIIRQVNENKGHFFDLEKHILYIRDQYGDIVVIDDVESFTLEIKNPDDEFGKIKTYIVKLNNGETFQIKKTAIDFQ